MQPCRLTGQSFLIFLPSRSSGAVERRPGAFDRVVVSGGGLGHRRVGVDTFPTGGVPLRVPGGFREDRRSRPRWRGREGDTSELCFGGPYRIFAAGQAAGSSDRDRKSTRL